MTGVSQQPSCHWALPGISTAKPCMPQLKCQAVHATSPLISGRTLSLSSSAVYSTLSLSSSWVRSCSKWVMQLQIRACNASLHAAQAGAAPIVAQTRNKPETTPHSTNLHPKVERAGVEVPQEQHHS